MAQVIGIDPDFQAVFTEMLKRGKREDEDVTKRMRLGTSGSTLYCYFLRIYLSFYGLTRPLLLRADVFCLWRAGATHDSGLSCCRAQAPGTRASGSMWTQ